MRIPQSPVRNGSAGHEQGRSHVPKTLGSAFAIGIALNVTFVLIEAAFGFVSMSIGVQLCPLRATAFGASARAVGAGRGCGDGASAG